MGCLGRDGGAGDDGIGVGEGETGVGEGGGGVGCFIGGRGFGGCEEMSILLD